MRWSASVLASALRSCALVRPNSGKTVGFGSQFGSQGFRPQGRRIRAARQSEWHTGSTIVADLEEVTVAQQPVDFYEDDVVPIEELARRQGVGPITDLSELAHPDLWDSDEDYEAFLADLYASRRSDAA